MSPTGLRSVWLRHGPQTFTRRLAALEKKAAEDGLLLAEVQVAALERKREEQMEYGEIEAAHPGYLGSQDTFYVSNMKGVGRSRPSSIPTPRWPSPSSIRRRRRSPPRTC